MVSLAYEQRLKSICDIKREIQRKIDAERERDSEKERGREREGKRKIYGFYFLHLTRN